MSLQRLAHRLATVAALRGRTLAGEAVRDSAIPPIDMMAGDERRPFVSVYTDDGGGVMRGLVPGTAGGTLAIVIEIGVTAQMENDEEWGIPTTDAGMEITLDIIERQICCVLMSETGAPAPHLPLFPEDDFPELYSGITVGPFPELYPRRTVGPWSEMWRRLHSGDPQITSVRGASAVKGLRFAGRQIKIEVKPYAEPSFGPAPTKLWADFLDLVAADGVLAPLAPTIRAMIEADAAPLDWQATMRTLGLSRGEADALLVAKVEGADAADVTIGEINAAPAHPGAS